MGLVDVAGIGGFVEMGWTCCVLGCILMNLRFIFTTVWYPVGAK